MNPVRQKIHRMFWSIVLISLVVYVSLIAFLFVFQSSLVYFPVREITMTPHDVGLPYEAVFFETTDGVKLSGWFIPVERPRGIILFCHGNGGNISHRLDAMEIFYHLGFSIFIFDYRGYGQSQGKPTEPGTYRDAEAAWHYLMETRQVTPADVIIFGESLGGAIAAWLAQHYVPRALILASTFTSIQDMASEIYPYFPVRLISRFNYNTLDYLQQVSCPVLIIHSPEDDIVPFHHGRRLFEAAKAPKEFLEIKGTHNEGFLTSGELYLDGLNAFISKYSQTAFHLKNN